jgi:serine/threonine protein kinase
MAADPEAERGEPSPRKSDDDLIAAALRQERRPASAPCNKPALPERIGRYRTIRYLGEGGMGVVYEAEQANPTRRVALKVTRKFTSGIADLHVFHREVEALGRLHHPSIAQIYDADQTDDGRPYFVMELIYGRSLRKYIAACDPSLSERLELFSRVCTAAQYAHQRGVIHRDLKPENILVDDDGFPHVLDFGLAKIIDPDMKVTWSLLDGNKLVGSLPYMRPEQTRTDALDLDFRTDVYSLGVILFELLTSTYPYKVCGLVADVLRNIAEAEPLRPSSLHRKIDREVETIVLRALAKERDRRYSSAEALGDDVQRYLEGKPIAALRDSSWYQLRKLAARHRFASIVLATFTVTILSFSAISGEYYFRATQAEQRRNRSDWGAIQAEQRAAAYQQVSVEAVRKLTLGWFLAAWHEDRLDAARALQAAVRRDTPEFLAMAFLLDPNYDAGQLQHDLGESSASLAHLVIAERALEVGDANEAVKALERSDVLAEGDLLMRAFVGSRLKEARAALEAESTRR